MVFIAIIVRGAEKLNQLGNQYWKKFSTQNYFDRNGIFMMIMISTPLLLYSFIILICYLREAKDLLIQVKTKQIKKQMLDRSKEASSSSKNKKNNKTKKND